MRLFVTEKWFEVKTKLNSDKSYSTTDIYFASPSWIMERLNYLKMCKIEARLTIYVENEDIRYELKSTAPYPYADREAALTFGIHGTSLKAKYEQLRNQMDDDENLLQTEIRISDFLG